MKRIATQFKRFDRQFIVKNTPKKVRASYGLIGKKMLFIDANEFLYATATKFASISLDDYLALDTNPKYYSNEPLLTIASTGTTKKPVAR